MEPETVIKSVKSLLEPLGFECHPFKIEWYNKYVKASFTLDYDPDTLAMSIISTPCMFEKTLKPFILRKSCTGVKDPIDECMAETLQSVKQNLPEVEMDILLDYELDHIRRPRVLVQTAGHVAGAVRYYQRSDIVKDPWPPKRRIFGVCVHPRYGGWFAFRGVLVFKNIQAPDLPKPSIPDPLPEDEQRVELLKRFNGCWKDWTYRDVIPVTERYSEEQKLYFATLPKDRKQLVEKMINDAENSGG